MIAVHIVCWPVSCTAFALIFVVPARVTCIYNIVNQKCSVGTNRTPWIHPVMFSCVKSILLEETNVICKHLSNDRSVRYFRFPFVCYPVLIFFIFFLACFSDCSYFLYFSTEMFNSLLGNKKFGAVQIFPFIMQPNKPVL